MYATLQRQPAPAPAPPTAKGIGVMQAKLAGSPQMQALSRQGERINHRVQGPAVVQGFWPELALLGGATGLGYWLFNRNRQNQAQQVQERRDARANRIHLDQRTAMVESLRDETESMAKRRDVEVTGDLGTRSEASINSPYRVNVNPRDPISGIVTTLLSEDPALSEELTPILLRTARMHELTHVSVAEGYGGRNKRRDLPYNMVDSDNRDEYLALQAHADTLYDLLQNDPDMLDLPPIERQIIEGRLGYMQTNAGVETDTVLNELVYYMHLRNIPARSAFSRELVSLTRERQKLRAPKFARRRK